MPALDEAIPPPPSCTLAPPGDAMPEETLSIDHADPPEPVEPAAPVAGAASPSALAEFHPLTDAPLARDPAAPIAVPASPSLAETRPPLPEQALVDPRNSAARPIRPTIAAAVAKPTPPGSVGRSASVETSLSIPPATQADQPASPPQVAAGAEPAPVRPARRRSVPIEQLPTDTVLTPGTASPAIAAPIAPLIGAGVTRSDARPIATQPEPVREQTADCDGMTNRVAPAVQPSAEPVTQRTPEPPVTSPSDSAAASFTPTVAATPLSTTKPAPPQPAEPVAAAVPGRIGHDTGVAIARHIALGGGETIAIRLDPAEMGRVDVRLSFDDRGTLQAVVAADNPTSLDLLRRESPELVRALAEAGVAADGGSFRFDARSGGGSGGQGWQRPTPVAARGDAPDPGLPDEATITAAYRPVRTRGHVDLMA